MADGIHATMHRLQPSPRQTVTDSPPTEATLEQLHPRDDAVLALSQLGDQWVQLTRVIFGPYVGHDLTLV